MKTTYTTLKREMARAYREKRKRMTRRVIKWPKWIQDCDYSLSRIAEIINSNDYRGIVKRGCCDGIEHQYRCPYGTPGDQLILGTTWAVPECYDHLKPTELPKYEGTGLHDCMPIDIWSYFDSDEKPDGFGKLRPGRFLPGFLRDRMPRETLKIVRAERVQDITNEEAILEGIFETPRDPGFDCWSTYGMRDYYPMPRDAFRALWDRINADRGFSWDSNPWVWVLGW
jgi:hypothetical protein